MRKIIYLITWTIITSCTMVNSTNHSEQKESTAIPILQKTKKTMGLSLEQKEEINTALRALLKRKNADAYVIINILSSDNYIQFALDKNSELFFDFPTIQLNTLQINKAKKALLPYDVQFEVVKSNDPNKKEVIREFSVFNKNLKTDVKTAIIMTEKVITEVFDLRQNIPLQIDEN
ncbi:hypothetical protein GCM10022393_19050 [Aquimarina addita]|uniref:Lipoprotein n=1 Tax=Aquimarina addita TaxID=870485 RepID=A0ABP6ULU4_9FLAO